MLVTGGKLHMANGEFPKLTPLTHFAAVKRDEEGRPRLEVMGDRSTRCD